jgi:hypothetical protein
LGASTTSEGASAKGGPFARSTMLRARASTAFLGLLGVAAGITTVFGAGGDTSGTGLSTAAASDGACAEAGPVRLNAVHRALDDLAVLGFFSGFAFDATVSGRSDDTPYTGLRAGTAGSGARLPVLPTSEVAIDWAFVLVASLGVLAGGASNTTPLSICEVTGASLGARTAGYVAGFEGFPCAYDAIRRASLVVATLDVGECGADVATVFSVSGDFPSAGLAARATTGGAVTPGAKVAEFAVNGACTVCAVFRYFRSAACDTTVFGGSIYGLRL